MSKINKIKLSGTTYDIQDLSATSVVNVTQAEYDALVIGGTVDPTTLYNITDAQAGDLSQYWTSAQTNSAITQAVSGKASQSDLETVSGNVNTVSGQVANKQDTLISGTNIKTINNTSLLGSGNIDIQGGGGSTYSAGTNISIDANNTINCTLPMKAETNNSSIYIGDRYGYGYSIGDRCIRSGYNPTTNGDDAICLSTNSFTIGTSSAIIGGRNNQINGGYAFIGAGLQNITNNDIEAAFGYYNNSIKTTSGFFPYSSGNTLFSVGNGTASNARHNAFEIRQNGDIYCSDGTNDVKLQDTITATAANTTALGGLSLVKLTQAEYDALATKDNSTLYVIVN